MMELSFKAFVGATIVVLIHLLSKTSNFYIAGLVVLFPALSLIAHYMVGSARGASDLRVTAIFGLCSLVPYLAYLFSVIFLSEKLKLYQTLTVAVLLWCLFSFLLIILWRRYV